MFNGKVNRKELLTRLVGDENSINRIPVLNRGIVIYVGAVLLCYCLYLIAPFVTFIAQTPLYSMQSYLGILGALLLCIDLVTNRGLWRGKYVALLYGLCVLAVISSLRTISYGIKDNLFLICWTAIEFALFYSCAYRLDSRTFGRYLRVIYYCLAVIWFLACCVSVYQYVFQIGYIYVVDPVSADQSAARQGFVENRLFGVFNPLNHSVYVSLMLLIVGVYYMASSKQKLEIAGLAVMNLSFLLHVILSVSRSALVAGAVCVFIVTFLLTRGKVKGKGVGKLLISVAAALTVTLLCAGGYVVLKNQLAKVPVLVQQMNPVSGPAEGEVPPEVLEPEVLPPEEAGMLDRTDLSDDLSNNRFRIWGDYLSIYQDVGLAGISPGNYMPYVRDHHGELYIVTYIQQNFPEKYEAGSIYHVHNGYIMTYVSAGILGVVLMLAFIALCAWSILRHIVRSETVSREFAFALALSAAGAVSAVFDKGVFFMNNPSTFMFWLALGIVMKDACQTKKEALK